jgi:hypothetical protein
MRGAIPPLPNMSSRRGTQLKYTGKFASTFYTLSNMAYKIFTVFARDRSGAHLGSYPMGTGGSFPESRAAKA